MTPSQAQPSKPGAPDKPARPSNAPARRRHLDAAWALATQPALVRTGEGRMLATPERFALHQVLDAASGALALLLNRTVTARIERDAPRPRAAFVAEFVGPQGASVTLAVSDDLARLIVDALTVDLTELRGVGALTEAELGLLEFAVLACLDACSATPVEPGRDAAGYTVQRFAQSGAVVGAQGATLNVVGLRVALGQQSGAAELRYNDAVRWAPPAALSDEGLASLKIKADTAVRVGVALPGFAMSDAEVQGLAAGDAVMLGVSTLAGEGHAPVPVSLLSDTGWCVGHGQIMADHATHLQVRVTPCKPALPDEAADVRCVIGELATTLGDVRDLKADALLDVPKNASLPATLWVAERAVARGELAQLDGMPALHITEVMA